MLPSLLIIGVPKAGTTSLADSLSSLDQYYLPEQKELYFFSRNADNNLVARDILENTVDNIDLYVSFFKSGLKNIDASTNYLYYADSVIKEVLDVYNFYEQKLPKIIVVLRNPVSRYISHYNFNLSKGLERFSLEKVIESGSSIKGRGWAADYYGNGLYVDRINKFKDAGFDVLVESFESLVRNGDYSKVKSFLGIDNEIVQSWSNITCNIGNQFIAYYLLGPNFVKRIISSKMPYSFRKYLRQVRDDFLLKVSKQRIVDLSTRSKIYELYEGEVCKIKKEFGFDYSAKY